MNTFVSITMRGTTFGIIYNTKLCRQQLGRTAPPARKAIELLEDLGVLREITGKQRGRVYAYHEYLEALVGDDG